MLQWCSYTYKCSALRELNNALGRMRVQKRGKKCENVYNVDAPSSQRLWLDSSLGIAQKLLCFVTFLQSVKSKATCQSLVNPCALVVQESIVQCLLVNRSRELCLACFVSLFRVRLFLFFLFFPIHNGSFGLQVQYVKAQLESTHQQLRQEALISDLLCHPSNFCTQNESRKGETKNEHYEFCCCRYTRYYLQVYILMLIHVLKGVISYASKWGVFQSLQSNYNHMAIYIKACKRNLLFNIFSYDLTHPCNHLKAHCCLLYIEARC